MKKIWLIIAVILAGIGLCFGVSSNLFNRIKDKYSGHGFDYMNGYSSTDFTGYHVYDGDKLARLDHEPPFIIRNEKDMPVLDGAEACYPLYNSIALTLYQDIGAIEKNYLNHPLYGNINGRYVSFTNSSIGYQRLIEGYTDLFFGARPSQMQKDLASDRMEQIETIPIGREAFVFFVEEDNPVDNLSSEDIRNIYSGKITNWKEVGGKDQEIIAFQRPENAGSQVMMRYFMQDTALKEPMTYEIRDSMAGVINKVAEYANEEGAIGYTFRYFLTELQQEKHVKILSVDGIAPTTENIKNESYPVIASLVAAKLVSNNDQNVSRIIDFILSEDGQELVEKSGYAPLNKTERNSQIENELPEIETYEITGTKIRLNINQEDTSYAKLMIADDFFNGFWAYYGQEVDESLKDTYQFLWYPEDGTAAVHIVTKQTEEGYRIIGYMINDKFSDTAVYQDGWPEIGSVFQRTQ